MPESLKPKKKESAERAENTENEIITQFDAAKVNAEMLAKNIKAFDKEGISYHTELLGDTMNRIQRKYEGLVTWINTITIPFAAMEIGSLGKDIISQDKLHALDFTLNQNIDWADIASRGANYAAIAGAIYAVARCGALVLKWKREAHVARNVNEQFQDKLVIKREVFDPEKDI